MGINAKPILTAVRDHALASGLFDAVNGHEPKSAPGRGLTAAVWVDEIRPAPGGSGLARTSAVFDVNVRLYTSMLADPQDAIDPGLVDAVDTLMAAYSGGFTLGGLVRSVDLLGAASEGLRARAGYLEQDGHLYRVMTIFLPMVVDDAWEQLP